MNNKLFLPFLTILSPILIYLIFRFFFPELLIFDNLLSTLEELYKSFGIYIIFVAGIAESIFLLNIFVPGSVVILLGAVLATKGIVSLPIVIVAGTTGLLIGYSLNYFIGKYGWYKVLERLAIFKLVQKTEQRLKNQNNLVIFLSGFNPNAASVVSLASGILNIGYKRFLVLIAITQVFWSTFWGILFYIYGIYMLENAAVATLIALILIIMAYFVINFFFNRKELSNFSK